MYSSCFAMRTARTQRIVITERKEAGLPGPTKSRLGSNLAFLRLKLGRRGAQVRPHLGATFGPSWGLYRFKMEDVAGPIRNPQNTRIHWYFPRFFFAIDDASFEAMFPMLCLRWAQLGAKLPPKQLQAEPCWTWLGPTCGITWLQFGVHLDLFGPNFSATLHQLAPTCSPVMQLRSGWAKLGRFGGSPGQTWGFNATRWKLAFVPLSPTFCGFDGVLCKAMLPTLGLSFWAQLQRQMPPHATKLRMLSQRASKRAHVAPRWTPVGPSWSQLASF